MDFEISSVLSKDALQEIDILCKKLIPLWLEEFKIKGKDRESRIIAYAKAKEAGIYDEIKKLNNKIAMVILCDSDKFKISGTKKCVVDDLALFGSLLTKNDPSLSKDNIDEIFCQIADDCKKVFDSEEKERKKKEGAVSAFEYLVSTIPKNLNNLLHWLSDNYTVGITFIVEDEINPFDALPFIRNLSSKGFDDFEYNNLYGDNWKIVDSSSGFFLTCEPSYDDFGPCNGFILGKI